MPKRPIAVVIAVVATLSLQLHAKPKAPEVVFQEAEQYTVRIYGSTVIALEGAERGSWQGSGFVVHIDKKAKKAYVATNRHVIGKGISSLQVSFKDGERFKAKPIYIDPVYDFGMVVFSLDEAGVPKSIQAAALGTTKGVAIGHPVGTFGNPKGLEYCATQGIISSTTNSPGGMAGAFLQTDASINAGNSGGPLISMSTGAVIGINTAVTDDAQGIGWSLAIDQIAPLVGKVIDGSLPYAGNQGWLGVVASEINPERAQEDFGATWKGEPPRKALLVLVVAKGTPAEKAGVKVGDVILSLDEVTPEDNAHFVMLMREAAGKTKTLAVCRLGKEVSMEVDILDMGELRPKQFVVVAGMVVQPETPTIYDNLYGIPSMGSVYISDVLPGSSAEAWGVTKFFPIRGVVKKLVYHEITSLEDFWSVVEDLEPGEPLELFIGSEHYGNIFKLSYFTPSEAPKLVDVPQ